MNQEQKRSIFMCKNFDQLLNMNQHMRMSLFVSPASRTPPIESAFDYWM